MPVRRCAGRSTGLRADSLGKDSSPRACRPPPRAATASCDSARASIPSALGFAVASPKLSRRVEKVLPYAPLSGVKFEMFCATVLICPTRQSQTSSCMPTIEALKASGVDWTVVSPSFAMETALAVQARLLAATGAMCGCTAREPLFSRGGRGRRPRLRSRPRRRSRRGGLRAHRSRGAAARRGRALGSPRHRSADPVPGADRARTPPRARRCRIPGAADRLSAHRPVPRHPRVQTRRATGTEPGARIVYLSGSDGRPVRDPSLRRLRSSCISAAHEVPADVACEQPPPCLADRPRRPACVAADERQRDARRHPGTHSRSS
jgi:hypothetical protein